MRFLARLLLARTRTLRRVAPRAPLGSTLGHFLLGCHPVTMPQLSMIYNPRIKDGDHHPERVANPEFLRILASEPAEMAAGTPACPAHPWPC